MPLHVAIWSQIVMDSDLSWEDQGKSLRLLANAWSSGELDRKPWASDAAWQAAERMWPEMAKFRAEAIASREKLSEAGRKGNAVRWASPGDRPPIAPGSPPESPGDRIQIRNQNQNPNQEQKQESKTLEVLPSDKPTAPRDNWITPYCDAWQDRTGGEMVVKHALKPISKLRNLHGDAAVIAAWRRYLDQTEVQFCSVTQFASKYGQWAGTAEPPRSREAEILRQLRDEGPVDDPFEAAWQSRGKALLS